MLTGLPQAGGRKESGELYWSCHAPDGFRFARPAPSNGTVTVIAARGGQPFTITFLTISHQIITEMNSRRWPGPHSPARPDRPEAW